MHKACFNLPSDSEQCSFFNHFNLQHRVKGSCRANCHLMATLYQFREQTTFLHTCDIDCYSKCIHKICKQDTATFQLSAFANILPLFLVFSPLFSIRAVGQLIDKRFASSTFTPGSKTDVIG